MIRAVLVSLALALSIAMGPQILHAVTPDEVLDDPVLEERARGLSAQLRCMVCRNESIDESNADLARDMRLLVRERLVAGDSDEEVIAFLVARYGEYVLLTPTATGANLVLWLAAPAMLLFGGGIAALYLRSRAKPKPPGALSDDEKKRLAELLED